MNAVAYLMLILCCKGAQPVFALWGRCRIWHYSQNSLGALCAPRMGMRVLMRVSSGFLPSLHYSGTRQTGTNSGRYGTDALLEKCFMQLTAIRIKGNFPLQKTTRIKAYTLTLLV